MQHGFCDLCRGVDQMLAVVQHQQGSLVPDRRRDPIERRSARAQREAQRLRDDGRNGVRRTERP